MRMCRVKNVDMIVEAVAILVLAMTSLKTK